MKLAPSYIRQTSNGVKNRVVAGLDIGTSAIKVLVVLKKSNSHDFEVLGKFSLPNSGMRRGVVIRPEEVSQRIRSVLTQVRDQTSQKIDEALVNISGSHVFLTSSQGSVVVSRADQNISQEDIERVIQSAKTFSLPPNREIIDFFPKQFIIDGEAGIKEPLGLKGVRLETEILALGVFSPYFKNLTKSVLGAGLKIADFVCNPISSAKSCLTLQQKELGVALLDIGAGVTDLAVYEEGDLKHLAVLPVGSEHITNDIAIGLRTDTAVAEKIKKEFGCCLGRNNKKISFPLNGDSLSLVRVPVREKRKSFQSGKKEKKLSADTLVFSSKFLNKIIEARVSEIFSLAQREIKKSSSGILPAGIVITGGGAKLPNIVELAKKELKLPARTGIPILAIGKQEEDPTFSVVWGLVLSAMDECPVEGFWDFGKGMANKIKKAFKVFIP